MPSLSALLLLLLHVSYSPLLYPVSICPLFSVSCLSSFLFFSHCIISALFFMPFLLLPAPVCTLRWHLYNAADFYALHISVFSGFRISFSGQAN
jgi:hypothetical protein